MNTLKKLDDQLTHLNNNLPAMGDIPKQIGQKKNSSNVLKSLHAILIFRFIKRFT